MKTSIVALCVLLSACLSAPAKVIAQQTSAVRPQPAPVTAERVQGNIYQLKGGSGANSGFFVGEKEVIVIDAKMSDESAGQILAEISKVSALPVRKIVLTHSDGDHVNGLTGFPAGIDVISHENTRKHIVNAFRTDAQRAYLPNITFTERMYLSAATDSTAGRIAVLYFGPAHTDGDAVVFFPDEKVAFVGDLVFLGRDPLIHRTKNGTSFGLVKVLKAILDLDVTTILSGHNEKLTKEDIRTFLRGIEEKQEKIIAMVKVGKTLDEVKKMFNVDTDPSRPGNARWPSLVEVIYLDATSRK